MAEITLLRHGQASFGAENYDQLSNTGRQQALWYGEHQQLLGQSFDKIVSGTMQRQLQTVECVLTGLGKALPLEAHSGFNEYNFSGLLATLKTEYPEQWLASEHPARDYHQNLRTALSLWMAGTISNDGIDTWPAFCERILLAFNRLKVSSPKRTLLVSSGGVISVLLGEILQLGHPHIIDISLQIKNTSANKIFFTQHKTTLANFNDLSHLHQPGRLDKISYT